MMDSELRNFKNKVATLPKVKALIWIIISFFNISIHYFKKFKKKTAQNLKDPPLLEIYQNSKIQKLSFLTNNEDLFKTNFNVKQSLSGQIDWKFRYSDEQYLHILHRMRDLPFLSEENILNFSSNLINDWNRNNPLRSLPGWHPYTLSERIISLCFTLHFMSTKIRDTDVEQVFKITIAEHTNFLRSNFEFRLGHHNHLINNARALIIASTLLPDLKQAPEWRNFALKIFKLEWPYQVLSDGVHAEQSVSYHFLLTRTLWEMKYLIEQAGANFTYGTELDKMIRYAKAITRPDGTIPFIGHITPDWHWKELIGLLPVWGEDVVPLSDLGRLYKLQLNKGIIHDNNYSKVLLFPSAGQAIIRTEKIHAVLCCDSRGIITAHGDQNLLGLDIWYCGTHLIRDAGLASYNLDTRREWYESWKGQSTFSIDGFNPIVSNWRKRQLPKDYYKITTTLQRDEENSTFKASHTGYCRLPDPVIASRKLHVSSEENIIIEDELQCKGLHTYQSKFHFGNNTIEKKSSRTIHITNKVNNTTFEFSWKKDIDFIIEENPFAIGYGEEMMGVTGSFEFTFTGDTKIEYSLKPI